MIEVLLIAGCTFFLLALHPFVTYPLSLRGLKRLRSALPIAVDRSQPAPSFAVCTCAYNEERIIAAKIENLLALRERFPDLEILVYIDASSDSTAQIAARYADRITLQVAGERHGKTHGMNRLVAMTTADILVFTDANVLLDPLALNYLVPYFSDPRVGCVCGNLNYTNGSESVTSSTGSLYWRLEESLKRLESELGSMMGADGSLFAMRRSLHRPPPDHIIDDMYVSFNVLCDGYRVIQAADVRAFEESIPVAAEEFRRKVRIACQAFNVHRLIWPRIRQTSSLTLYMYVSHKLLRWFSIYLLGASVVSFVAALLIGGWTIWALSFLCAGAILLGLGYRWSIRPFSQIVDILAALLGTGIGVWRSLGGEVYQTWKPATSIRK